jgi:hypothetical protein
MPVGSRSSQTIQSTTPSGTRLSASLDLDAAGNAGTVRATTISFTAPGTISDSANHLAGFKVNDIVVVEGSALNSRNFLVNTSSAGVLTVLPAVVTTEAAGQSILIVRD